MTQPRRAYVLGLYANSRGLSWIIFDGPLSPLDWGNLATRCLNRQSRSLRAVERLLDRYHPDAVIMESFSVHSSPRRSARIRKLCHALSALAVDRGCEIAIYTRREVAACFQELGAGTRQEIAEAIGRHIRILATSVPKPRKPWQSERPRLGIFCAAALVLTHHRYRAANVRRQPGLHALWCVHANASSCTMGPT